MDTYKFMLTGPAALMLLICIYHSWRTRGARFTLIFFGLGIVMFWLREYLGSNHDHYKGMPQYFHPRAGFKIAGVPAPVIGGWLLNCYIGWSISERIVDRVAVWRGRLMPVIVVAGIVISSMALAIEATGIELGWWVWAYQDLYQSTDPFREFLQRTPLVALQGWPVVALWFLIPVLSLECSPLKNLSAYRWLLAVPWWVIYYVTLHYFFLEVRFFLLLALVLLTIFLKTAYLPPTNPYKTRRPIRLAAGVPALQISRD
ncbi:hypothetical protein K8I61_10140 [bacterium]|nr:hypothetical protein [bacterium]